MFWVGNLPLVLDAVLSSGKQHTSGHAKASLKRLIGRLFGREDWSRASDASQGWQTIEDSLGPSG
jgi:hypothetical protein